jgi:tetratricopeptide (TPR) repeat protein
MTEKQLELANREADRGNYRGALELLVEARRLAVSTDRPVLRIRTSLSQGNVLAALGRTGEAEALWRSAEAEAREAGDAVLAAACRVYLARNALITAGAEDKAAAAGETLDRVQREAETLVSDRLLCALGWTVIGLAEKELGRYAEAEGSILNALTIHEEDRYLEQAAYDWYLIASIRSVAGLYGDAIAALDAALGFDRRAENTHGLAMDWAARGEVYRKMGDTERAAEAWRRSAEILRTLDHEEQAAAMENRADEAQSPGTGTEYAD